MGDETMVKGPSLRSSHLLGTYQSVLSCVRLTRPGKELDLSCFSFQQGIYGRLTYAVELNVSASVIVQRTKVMETL